MIRQVTFGFLISMMSSCIILMLFLLLYVYGGDDYLVNLIGVNKTTKRSDFTVISPVFFSKMRRDFADFYRDFLKAIWILCFLFNSIATREIQT